MVNLKNWKLLYQISLPAVLIIILAASSLYVSQQQLKQSKKTALIVEEVDHINNAFSLMIQEWKNVLLRSHYEKSFEERRQKFTNAHLQLEHEIDDVILHTEGLDYDNQELKQFKKDLMVVVVKYGTALEHFDYKKPLGFIKIDKEVKGIDRKLSNDLKTIFHNIEKSSIRRTENSNIRLSSFTLILGTAAFFITFLVQKYLRGNVSTLVNAMNEVASGNYHFKAKVDTGNEMGDLASKLNKISSNFNEVLENEKSQLATIKESSNIKEQVKALSSTMNKIAQGDLRERINTSELKGLGDIGRNVNTIAEQWQLSIKETKLLTDAVNETTEVIKALTQSQAQAVSNQSTATQQTSVSVKEITETTTETLRKTEALGEMANTTRLTSQKGKESISNAMDAMNNLKLKVDGIAQNILALNERMQQIRDINEAVSSIAQQSKMLALNASIEAAKAGDAGRGFAVVADEVRELAEQSQQSTSQVEKILSDIRSASEKAVMSTEEGINGVNSSVKLVEESGIVVDKLDDVVNQTEQASKLIMSAVNQETVAMKQIQITMQDINNNSKQVGDQVKLLKSESEKLITHANTLKTRMDRFAI